MKFYFNIVKTTMWTPRYKASSKNLVIQASNYDEAKALLEKTYPNWEVSMFWPIHGPWRPNPNIKYKYLYVHPRQETLR